MTRRSLLTRLRQALVILGLLLVILLGLVMCGSWIWAEAQIRAARQALEQHHHLEALRYLDRCRWLRPDQPEVLLLSARLARRTGRTEEARQFLDLYWRQRGDDDALTQERLLLRASEGEIEALSDTFLRRVEQHDPASPLFLEALILGCIQRLRLVEARQFLDRWQKLEPDAPGPLWYSARLLELNDASEPDSYRSLLERDPGHDDARIRLAEMLVRLGHGAEALEHLDYVRPRVGWLTSVEVARAGALELLGRTDEAIVVLDEILRRDPASGAALAERGRLARIKGDNERAVQWLREAIERDPGNVTSRYQLYLTLNRMGKTDEARKSQQKILELEEDLKRMRTIINDRLPRSPSDPNLYYELAMIALRAGIPRETHRWLQVGLQVDPDHLPTHRALATYYQKMGNPVLSSRHRSLAQRLSQKP